MKVPTFLSAMEHIDEELILEVTEEQRATTRPSRKKQWVAFGAVAATFALILTTVFALPMLTKNDQPRPPLNSAPELTESSILPIIPEQTKPEQSLPAESVPAQSDVEQPDTALPEQSLPAESVPAQSDTEHTDIPSPPMGNLNATIALDVNPSLEIEIDEDGRVIGICAINEDAELVVQDLAAYGTDLSAAVDAIMDAMVENGFLSAEKNDILLSVDTADTALAATLRESLSAHIKEHLNANNIEASVITQSYNKDEEPVHAGVSTSKSTLCRVIWDCCLPGAEEKTWPELADMSIEELNAIVEEAPHLLVDGYSRWRQRYPSTLHGLMFPQNALDMALAYSGLAEKDVSNIHIELEEQEINSEGFFIVTYESDGMVYRYEIFCQHSRLDSDGITGTSGVAHASVRPVDSTPDDEEVTFQNRYLSLEEVRTYPFALGLADETAYYVVFQEDFFGILGGEPVFYIHLANYNDRKDTHTYLFNAITGEYISEPTENRFVSWKDYLAEITPTVYPE